jgi:hypothetical protein
MFFLSLFTIAYLMIAAFSLVMTYDEQQQTGERGLGMRTLGFLACLFWPVTFVTVALAARTTA